MADARCSVLEVQVTGMEQIPDDLSTLNQFTVYRLIQEMLTNMLRHASEPIGALEIRARGRDLTITAENPTVPGEYSGGFGLAGMAERVRARWPPARRLPRW